MNLCLSENRSRPKLNPVLLTGEERGVSACGRRIDRVGAFERETLQVMRAAGFRAGARQPFPAERLDADHRADLIAVHIHIPDMDARAYELRGLLDAAVDAERQAVARRIDRVAHLTEFV